MIPIVLCKCPKCLAENAAFAIVSGFTNPASKICHAYCTKCNLGYSTEKYLEESDPYSHYSMYIFGELTAPLPELQDWEE